MPPQTAPPSRDDLAAQYLTELPYEPYPVQEEALLAWFTEEQGVMVCAPTGTGKTLIAEAAMFEALHLGKTAYYTTPLIALTEQKFDELQASAEKWGFDRNDVGLVTGNRRVNPQAKILVVVAEILLNRLMHREAFDFTEVTSVVMDEFHSFNDPERGVVWELTLGMLPAHVRLLLLSATVGNAMEFDAWMRRAHGRNLKLVQSTDRKVPLSFQWVGDQLLAELMESLAFGDDDGRRTPALLFCFNREHCWTMAEMLKGKNLIQSDRRKELLAELEQIDFSHGVGPKLKQLLGRGVGVHHAGVLPKYRRIVEDLYQRKLLSVAVCTETLSAGINLPARSVVVPELLKGPPEKKKLIEPSTAHQIFGRAGRPQYDSKGYVYALAHEDDVKILRWKEQYDKIPEDTKDPGLRKAKKNLKKKMPKRRTTEQYWTEQQFEKLRDAPPSKLQSKGAVPWRLLAYLLDASPEIGPIRDLVGKRLMPDKQLEQGQKELDRRLMTLWRAGYVELEPHPPAGKGEPAKEDAGNDPGKPPGPPGQTSPNEPEEPSTNLSLADLTLGQSLDTRSAENEFKQHKKTNPSQSNRDAQRAKHSDEEDGQPAYQPVRAIPTDRLTRLTKFRSVNPLYGVFLINQLGIADRPERLQAMESVLEMPGSVARSVRVPSQEELPPGPLAELRLDETLLKLGLATPEELRASAQEEDADRRYSKFEERPPRVLTVAEKLRMLFDHDFPGVHDFRISPVWVAGEFLAFGGDFEKYVTSHKLQRQEGIIFRHLLRLILLIGEFSQLTPPDLETEEWLDELDDISAQITDGCRAIDPASTEKVLEQVEQTETFE